jgi:hypothetical protein
MRIHIKCLDGCSASAEIITPGGERLTSIKAIDISLRAGEPVEASLQFLVPGVDAGCEATVSEAHLVELAAAHGYDLVPRARF